MAQSTRSRRRIDPKGSESRPCRPERTGGARPWVQPGSSVEGLARRQCLMGLYSRGFACQDMRGGCSRPCVQPASVRTLRWDAFAMIWPDRHFRIIVSTPKGSFQAQRALGNRTDVLFLQTGGASEDARCVVNSCYAVLLVGTAVCKWPRANTVTQCDCDSYMAAFARPCLQVVRPGHWYPIGADNHRFNSL